MMFSMVPPIEKSHRSTLRMKWRVIIKSEIQVGDTILVGLDKEKEEIKIDIVKPSAKAHPKKGK